jgi:predicted GH43/DUF377 family glycosyl hydrolase
MNVANGVADRNDEFYIIYGAADTNVGVSKIKVNIKK